MCVFVCVRGISTASWIVCTHRGLVHAANPSDATTHGSYADVCTAPVNVAMGMFAQIIGKY